MPPEQIINYMEEKCFYDKKADFHSLAASSAEN